MSSPESKAPRRVVAEPVYVVSAVLVTGKMLSWRLFEALPWIYTIAPVWLVAGSLVAASANAEFGGKRWTRVFVATACATATLIVLKAIGVLSALSWWGTAVPYLAPMLGLWVVLESLRAGDRVRLTLLGVAALSAPAVLHWLDVPPFATFSVFGLVAPALLLLSLMVGSNTLHECGDRYRWPMAVLLGTSAVAAAVLFAFEHVDWTLPWLGALPAALYVLLCETIVRPNVRQLRKKMKHRNRIVGELRRRWSTESGVQDIVEDAASVPIAAENVASRELASQYGSPRENIEAMGEPEVVPLAAKGSLPPMLAALTAAGFGAIWSGLIGVAWLWVIGFVWQYAGTWLRIFKWATGGVLLVITIYFVLMLIAIVPASALERARGDCGSRSRWWIAASCSSSFVIGSIVLAESFGWPQPFALDLPTLIPLSLFLVFATFLVAGFFGLTPVFTKQENEAAESKPS